MPMYFCCVGVFACLLCTVWCVPCCGCVPVVAWLNSNDGSRHLLVRCAWGVVEHVSRMFLIGPVLPRRVGVGCLNLCNFWILPVQHFVLVGLFLVGFGLFTACFC